VKIIRKQLITLILTLAFISIFSGAVSAADWDVGPTYTYQTIQNAIDNSNTLDGDVINVYPNGTGVYNENVIVNKNLTIKANSSGTVVNGSFTVTAAGSGSTIDGFTINKGTAPVTNGIYLNSASGCTINGNTINGFDNGNGIYLGSSDSNTITGNTITNCINGIYAIGSTINIISGNTINNNSNGIYLRSASNSNTIFGNTITDNLYGVYLWTSLNNVLTGNYVTGNLTSVDGITLDSASGNQVISNVITGFTNGIRSNSLSAEVHFNRIVGNRNFGLIKTLSGTVNATYNWWGSNLQTDVASKISGTGITYSPWLFMTINANPNPINNGETSLITVSFNNYSSDGITYTPFDPATGHILDGTPVTFNAERSIDGSSTTSGGIATATFTADGAPGEADVNAVTDSQTVNTSVMINSKSSLYLTVTPSKTNPVAGDTVVYTLKVGNNGPDTAENVVMTYVIPEGLEFVTADDDTGNTWTYDENTRTITWNLGTIPKGDPNLWLTLHVAQAGQYLINPALSTSTYDPTLESSIQSITVNAAAAQSNDDEPTGTTVNAQTTTETVEMQETGIPISMMVLAILMVLGGLFRAKRE